MAAEALLHAAVINNARWCDAVCRSHGYPGEFGGRLWISAGHALPFYPNAITLSPDVPASKATVGQDPSRPFAIKDSFGIAAGLGARISRSVAGPRRRRPAPG